MEELLAQTIAAARTMKAVDTRELSRVIVDSTVQEKAIAHPADSRLLDVAPRKLVLHSLTETAREQMQVWLERAERILTQRPKDKNKLYALHAPEVECISKGKSRKPYELGAKVGIAVTARKGLIVGARSFPGNPYDGDTLHEQLEQAQILSTTKPACAIVDLGYRGREVPGTQVLHKGQSKTLTRRQWAWVKRRQAIEPVIGHLKDDCRLRRCPLKGALGDALHVIGCAAGYNIRWLMRWLVFFGLLSGIARWRYLTSSRQSLRQWLAERGFFRGDSLSSPAAKTA